MTNSLIKNTILETVVGTEQVPAQPYIPPSPPRTVYENRTVCGWHYPAGAGTYSYVIDDDGEARLVFKPTVPAAVLATMVASWYCETAVVPVTYPGDPGQPYVPGTTVTVNQQVSGYNLGWNAGGRSIAIFTANASVEFKARASNVGAIVGMNLYDGVDAQYNGNTVDYGFYLAHGFARIIENGVLKASVGAYTGTTVFKITRTGTNIDYLMNAVSVATASSAPTTSGWLEACLYSGTDEVFDPVITQISAPDTTTQNGTIAASLSEMTMWASMGVFAGVEGVFLPMTMDGAAGELVPSYAVMEPDLTPLQMAATSLTGERGSIAASLSEMDMLAADHPYGEMIASLSEMVMEVSALEGNLQGFMNGVGVLASTMVSANFLVATMTSAGTLSSTMLVTAVVDAQLLSEAEMGTTWAVNGLYAALMQSAGIMGSVAGDPDNEDETWVVNLDSGGSTSYTNYGFNSFAFFNGKHYGANASGIYELAGDTDAGAPIRASISLGKRDAGSAVKKTFEQCYLGMSANGNLFVKVIAEGQEYIYKTRSFSPELQEQRVTFGKGLRTNYVTLEIYNEGGTDFELDTVQFVVADLTRKI